MSSLIDYSRKNAAESGNKLLNLYSNADLDHLKIAFGQDENANNVYRASQELIKRRTADKFEESGGASIDALDAGARERYQRRLDEEQRKYDATHGYMSNDTTPAPRDRIDRIIRSINKMDNGYAKEFQKGFTGGGAGVYRGISGLAGGVADFVHDGFGDAIGANDTTSAMDRLMNSLSDRTPVKFEYDNLYDYVTNPHGLARDFGNQAGSMAAMLPFAGAFGRVAGSAASAIGSKILPGATAKAAQYISNSPFLKYGLTTAPVEATAEGGNARLDMIKVGADKNEALLSGLETAAGNLPLLAISNTLEGKILGGKLVPRGPKGIIGNVATAPIRSIPNVAGGGLQQATEEYLQDAISSAATGKWDEFKGVPWENEDFNAALIPGLLMGAPGGMVDALAANSQPVGNINNTMKNTSDLAGTINRNINDSSGDDDSINPVPNPGGSPTVTADGSDNGDGTLGGEAVQSALDRRFSELEGTTMDNHTEGCVEAATKLGASYSSFLAQELANGVVYGPTLVQDAKEAGIAVIPYDESKLEVGDVIMYDAENDQYDPNNPESGNAHTVIYAGNGKYYGNSSSQDMVVMGDVDGIGGGRYPARIIKTGSGNGASSFNAASGNNVNTERNNINIPAADNSPSKARQEMEQALAALDSEPKDVTSGIFSTVAENAYDSAEGSEYAALQSMFEMGRDGRYHFVDTEENRQVIRNNYGEELSRAYTAARGKATPQAPTVEMATPNLDAMVNHGNTLLQLAIDNNVFTEKNKSKKNNIVNNLNSGDPEKVSRAIDRLENKLKGRKIQYPARPSFTNPVPNRQQASNQQPVDRPANQASYAIPNQQQTSSQVQTPSQQQANNPAGNTQIVEPQTNINGQPQAQEQAPDQQPTQQVPAQKAQLTQQTPNVTPPANTSPAIVTTNDNRQQTINGSMLLAAPSSNKDERKVQGQALLNIANDNNVALPKGVANVLPDGAMKAIVSAQETLQNAGINMEAAAAVLNRGNNNESNKKTDTKEGTGKEDLNQNSQPKQGNEEGKTPVANVVAGEEMAKQLDSLPKEVKEFSFKHFQFVRMRRDDGLVIFVPLDNSLDGKALDTIGQKHGAEIHALKDKSRGNAYGFIYDPKNPTNAKDFIQEVYDTFHKKPEAKDDTSKTGGVDYSDKAEEIAQKWINNHPFSYDNSKSFEENVAAANKILTDFEGFMEKFIPGFEEKGTLSINTPERQKLREDIMNKLYGSGAKNKNKEVWLIVGPPAAGKSSIADPIIEENGALQVDSDDAKALLPEFHNGVLAGAVHEESSTIANELLNKALSNGDNIVMPVVGKTLSSLEVKIEKFKTNGYTVHLVNVALPTEKTVERATQRFKHTGRYLDLDYVRSVGLKPQQNYDKLKTREGVDSYESWNNDVERGHKPILIERGLVKGAEDRNTGVRLGSSGTQMLHAHDGGKGETYSSPAGEVNNETGNADLVKHSEKNQGAISLQKNEVQGKTVTVVTDDGKEVNVTYKVISADDVIASNIADGSMATNPAYPKELQPRDRQRASMITQVTRMSNELRPADLADSRNLNQGAPVVRADNVVLNGNGRTIAIQTAIANGKADAYTQYIYDHADELGLDRNSLAGIKNPILVREIDSNANTGDVNSIITSTTGGQRMGASEQAKVDAGKIKPTTLAAYVPNDTGDLSTAANRDFVEMALRDILPNNDTNAYYNSKGEPTADALARVQRALFAKAYKDDTLIDAFTESMDDEAINISNALKANAANVARLQEGISNGSLMEMGLVKNLVDAVNAIKAKKKSNKPVEGIWMDGALFSESEYTQEMMEIAKIINDYRKSGKKINEFIRNLTAINVAHGNPNQSSLFGADEIESNSLMNDIVVAKEMVDNGGQRDLFGEAKGMEKQAAEANAGAESADNTRLLQGNEDTAGRESVQGNVSRSETGGVTENTANEEQKPQEKSERAFTDTKTAEDFMLKTLGLKRKNQKQKRAKIVDDSDEAMNGYIEEMRKALFGKLNANPIFDPYFVIPAFKFTTGCIQRGITSFEEYAERAAKIFGDVINEFTKMLWNTSVSYKSNSFDEDQMTAVLQYVGSKYESGVTDLGEIKEGFEKLVGKNEAKPFMPMIVAAYNGANAYFNPMVKPLKMEEEIENADDTTSGNAPRAGEGTNKNPVGTDDEGRVSTSGNGQGVSKTEGKVQSQDSVRVHDSSSAAGGKTGDSRVQGDRASDSAGGSGGAQLSGSVRDSLNGDGLLDNGREADSIEAAEERRINEANKIEKPKRAAYQAAGIDSVRSDLPMLLPEQQDDVVFAEQRLDVNEKAGVLFTNGTGTGKTFSGLGIVKRMTLQGKKNILIVAPSENVIQQWVEAAKNYFGLDIAKLSSTNDNGNSGIVITTYQNLGANERLIDREWDMVIADESHNLMSDKSGTENSYLKRFRALTKHKNGFYSYFYNKHADMIKEQDNLLSHKKDLDEAAKKGNKDAAELAKTEKKLNDIQNKINSLMDKEKAVWDSIAEKDKPKAVFLSATPFNYVADVEYAEGYLFNYNDNANNAGGHNKPNGRQEFFIEHFGYRMRYNKLTRPDGKVDNRIMEVEFHEWLKREGALSGRQLEVDADYDRGFLVSENSIGTKIDNAMDALRSDNYRELAAYINRHSMNRRDLRYLLECIKANEAVPIIKEYLKSGKKVVLFHQAMKSAPVKNPFDISEYDLRAGIINKEDANKAVAQMRKFKDQFPEFFDGSLNLSNVLSPRATMRKAFGDNIAYVNGEISDKEKTQNVKNFQKDDSGVNLIVVQQDAGNAGISLHDITGKHQRVLLNIGIPQRPSYAMQIEGRIYRVGVKTNAIFRYLTTGTNMERALWNDTVAQNTSTVENLSSGNTARGLFDSFREAYMETFDDSWHRRKPGHPEEGTGTKEIDRAGGAAINEWDRAKTMYYGRMKKTSKTKAAEGNDYYATPEPVGMKMVEWLDVKQGDRVLEPSAGHGAISRWFNEQLDKTIIEPSNKLMQTARLLTPGAKAISNTFENFDIHNKFNGIAMNPPFGTAGRTAVDHVAKAFKHLSPGGRLVAIIPIGSATAKFDKWYESDEAKEALVRKEILLPRSTFSRAGTSVATRIVIIDKITKGMEVPGYRNTVDLTHCNEVEDLFDALENMSAPERIEPADSQQTNNANNGESVFDTNDFVHTKTGENMVSAKPTIRLDDSYKAIASLAKSYGGRYSRFSKGFLFTKGDSVEENVAQRDKFVQAANAYLESLQNSEEAKFSLAYHGSPADFDRFTTDKMGTGEGNQVHGWGLYFAINKLVSVGYKRILSTKDTKVKSGYNLGYNPDSSTRQTIILSGSKRDIVRNIDYSSYPPKVKYYIADPGKEPKGTNLIREGSPTEYILKRMFNGESIKRINYEVSNELRHTAAKGEPTERLEAILNKLDQFEAGYDKGKLYTVEIPEINDMLDEAATYDKQPENVKKAIDNICNEMFSLNVEDVDSLTAGDLENLETKLNRMEVGSNVAVASSRLRSELIAREDIQRFLDELNNNDNQADYFDSLNEIVSYYGLNKQYADSIDKAFDLATEESVTNKEAMSRVGIDADGLLKRLSDYNDKAVSNYKKYFQNALKAGGLKEAAQRFIDKYKQKTGKQFYDALTDFFGGKNSGGNKKASMKLLENGVQGIKYNGGLDGPCCVVFNDETVQILEKYSARKQEKSINKMLKDIEFISNDETNPQQQKINQFADKMGVQVQWYKGDSRLHGFHKNGITYLNVNSEMPITQVFWHESFHWMKANNPSLYNKMIEHFAGTAAFSKEQLSAYRAKHGRTDLSDADTVEEMLADNMDEVVKRVKLFKQLGYDNSSLYKRFISWLSRVRDRFAEMFNSPDGRMTARQRDSFVKAFDRLAKDIVDRNGNQIFDGILNDVDRIDEKPRENNHVAFSNGDNDTNYSVNVTPNDNLTEPEQSFLDKAAEKLGRKLGLKTEKLLEEEHIRVAKPLEDKNYIDMISRNFSSPSRIAEKVPIFRDFYKMADYAMKKIVKDRNQFYRKLNKALDAVTEEEKTDAFNLLLNGDLEGAEYTADEVKALGYNDNVYKTYKAIRGLMNKAYIMVDKAKRRIQNHTATLNQEELDKLRRNKFVTIIRETPIVEEGDKAAGTVGEYYRAESIEGGGRKYRVTWKGTSRWSPKNRKFWEQTKIVNDEQLAAMKADEAMQVTYSEHVGNEDGVDYWEIRYNEDIPPVHKLKGYIPHFFHEYMIDIKDKDGNIVGKIGSGRTETDAIVRAEEWLKDHKLEEGQEIFIRPKQFDFNSLGMNEEHAAVVMGLGAYNKMLNKVAKNGSMSLAEAREMMNGVVKTTGHHRFFGNLLQRKGVEGYEQNLDWVLRHYFSMASRYAALETYFKPDAMNRFERLFGDFSKDYTGMANYIKDYINDINGKPSKLEQAISEFLTHSKLYRKWFAASYGERAALAVGNGLTNAVSYMTLGCANISSASLNLSQIKNSSSCLGPDGVAMLFKAMAKRGNYYGGKYSLHDMRILNETGVLNDIGMDSASGYDQRRYGKMMSKFNDVGGSLMSAMNRAGQAGMIPFKVTESFIRKVTVIAAYEKAIADGKNHKEAIEFAKEVNDKSNFEYGVQDAPNIFRRGSIISQIALQFKKYPIKELELMKDMMPFLGKETTAAQKAMYWGWYFLMCGLLGIPFLDWGDDELEKKTGFSIKDWGQRGLMEWAGKDKTRQTIANIAMYGILSVGGINISNRAGLSDVIPTKPSDFMGALPNKTYNFITDAITGNGANALRDISPGLYNYYTALVSQESKGKRGRVTNRYDDAWSRILRAMGFRSVEETTDSDVERIIKKERRKLQDKKQQAIDKYIDEPTAENKKKLDELEIKRKTVEDEAKKKKLDKAGRLSNDMNKKELQLYKGLLDYID